ncbi:unnamed protein product [Caenorhabditis auriculariae]|uniref:Uncharacterized protein n=1 Tax=Caenorhabditis auriculariae TaxID=2777116 RepID=A0A8S1HK97_9PELO|nr:unnamed protein product [Caenorhabditis auriculariae]
MHNSTRESRRREGATIWRDGYIITISDVGGRERPPPLWRRQTRARRSRVAAFPSEQVGTPQKNIALGGQICSSENQKKIVPTERYRNLR